VTPDPLEPLSPEAELALAHTPARVREALRTSLRLDQRLARIVGRAQEAMLARMRLAWWRDMLGVPARERSRGDAVLDAIAQHWQGHEAALAAAVDGWEHMLGEGELDAQAALAFARGRSAPLAAIARLADPSEHATADPQPGMVWALVDAALHVKAAEERALLLSLAQMEPTGKARASRSLRGVAVLDALARRSVRRGGRPLMDGRSAALVATRTAIFGR
jgi:phytoene synthase